MLIDLGIQALNFQEYLSLLSNLTQRQEAKFVKVGNKVV